MKNLKYFFMAALVVAGLVSCNNDESTPTPDDGFRGKSTTAQLVLNQSTPKTYGTSVTETADPEEETIAQTLDIYVFDGAGIFEKSYLNHGLNSGLAGQVTNSFVITAGKKYFYVFSNKLSITEPTTGTTRESFEKNVCAAVIASNNTNITVDDAFMIGTLWGEVTTVAGTGTTDTPERISLNIGRASAKVVLDEVKNVVKGNLQGTFNVNEANYRLHSVPTNFYLVGQYSNVMPPATGSMVVSAVHNEEPYASNGIDQNPIFKNYDFEATTNIGDAYYAIENTTAKQNGALFFGNTTFIQLRVQYLPKDGVGGEVYDATDASADAEFDPSNDGTFFTAYVNGILLIFNDTPSISIPGLDQLSIVEYKQGLNYYNIPIRDESEAISEQQYRVLRNHYYEMAVNSISRLGSGSPDVDPGTEIPEDKEVEISLTILPWSKISQGVDL